MIEFLSGAIAGGVLGASAVWLLQAVRAQNSPVSSGAAASAERAPEPAEAAAATPGAASSGAENAGAASVAGIDAVTKMPERQPYLEALEKWKFSERPGAVLMVRFPRAPVLRSSLGPQQADALMLAIATRLREAPLPIVFLGRLSSSSFGLLLDVPGAPEAAAAAHALSSALSKPFVLGAREVQLHSVIGVALLEGADAASEILRHAEIAAQTAQAGGRDEVVVFDVVMRRSLEDRHEIETDLRRAIYFEREQLGLAFQPIVELNSTRLAGFEALVRWKHPERGPVSPAQFIPIAEETGLIVPLWHFVFSLACRQLLEWQSLRPRGTPPLFMSVNLSSFQFFYPGLLKSIRAMTDLTGVAPSWIKLEITESGLMEDAELALMQLNALKEIGFSLSIDDFGTGYSSLSYLHRLPADDLKIDRSFVRNMHAREDNREIVRTITQLGRLLGMQVTAEGIETPEELKALRQLKCDYGQGYYFAKPMPALEAEVLVRAMGTPLAD